MHTNAGKKSFKYNIYAQARKRIKLTDTYIRPSSDEQEIVNVEPRIASNTRTCGVDTVIVVRSPPASS